MSPMYVYFSTALLQNGNTTETNRNLNFTKSAQAIIAYDVSIGKSTRIKTEVYYQYIFHVPVKSNPAIFSTLNLGADFNSPNVDSLVNNGLGTNYGMEFTLEKFLVKDTITYLQHLYFNQNIMPAIMFGAILPSMVIMCLMHCLEKNSK